MSALPVRQTAGDLVVIDPDTGEALPVRDASDHALAHAADVLAAHAREVAQARGTLAARLRERHGVGTARGGGFRFKVQESRSWPVGATAAALNRLLDRGVISQVDYDRAMPSRPYPDATQIKALLGRLVVDHPEAAAILAAACTVSPPSLREIEREAPTVQAVEQ